MSVRRIVELYAAPAQLRAVHDQVAAVNSLLSTYERQNFRLVLVHWDRSPTRASEFLRFELHDQEAATCPLEA